MIRKYKIANITMEVEYSHGERKWKQFQTSDENTDIHITMSRDEGIKQPSSSYAFGEYMDWSRPMTEDENHSLTIYSDLDFIAKPPRYKERLRKRDMMLEVQQRGNPIYQLEVNHDWNRGRIYGCKKPKEQVEAFTGPLGEVLFRNRLLFHHGVVIHGAAIEWNGMGIIFTAPSGTGKSTQARLWKKYMGAKLINEDRPALRIEGEEVYVYGTPWNGSSHNRRNCKKPLRALILIEQASTNSIELIDGGEGIKRILPRCFLPYNDKKLMDLAVENIDHIIRITPVYLLKCKPEKEAVERVCECLKLNI